MRISYATLWTVVTDRRLYASLLLVEITSSPVAVVFLTVSLTAFCMSSVPLEWSKHVKPAYQSSKNVSVLTIMPSNALQ